MLSNPLEFLNTKVKIQISYFLYGKGRSDLAASPLLISENMVHLIWGNNKRKGKDPNMCERSRAPSLTAMRLKSCYEMADTSLPS